MRKIVFFCLMMVVIGTSTAYSDDLQNVKTDQEALWAGSGAQDATFNAVSLSMLGWGVGLAGGIALIASAIHQSSSSHDSSSSSH
jgi:hypothetical protein